MYHSLSPNMSEHFHHPKALYHGNSSRGGEASLDAELNPGMQWQASVLTHGGFGGHHQAQAVREEAVGKEICSESQGMNKAHFKLVI